MKTVGFIKSDKENEKRIAIVPKDLFSISNINKIFLEEGYGLALGIEDIEYTAAGATIESRSEILKKDIIVDPKIGDAKYIFEIKNKVLFGWVHAVQNEKLTKSLVENNNKVFAWEDINENGRHAFWRNNEIAGEASIIHALTFYGESPIGKKAAILGNGNTARGAYRTLVNLGVDTQIFTRKMEQSFVDEIGNYDIIVNAVLWDIKRKDHIVYADDLYRMKKGSIIIDISCDNNGAIESSRPTNFANPTFRVNGVNHYAVENTPSLFYKTASREISKVCSRYLDNLICDEMTQILEGALIISNGRIIDPKITAYQEKYND